MADPQSGGLRPSYTLPNIMREKIKVLFVRHTVVNCETRSVKRRRSPLLVTLRYDAQTQTGTKPLYSQCHNSCSKFSDFLMLSSDFMFPTYRNVTGLGGLGKVSVGNSFTNFY